MTMPILNASGCLDALTAPSVAQSLDAFVTKTVTPLPREGNPPPRIAETEHGMLNSIGLQNPGIDAFLDDVLPRLSALGVPIWVSVGGFSAADYASTCERLDEREEVATIELNLSCPNVEEAPGGLRRARAGRAGGDTEAPLREALARDLGRRRERTRRRRRGSRRAVARQHDPWARARPANALAAPRARSRRLLRARR